MVNTPLNTERNIINKPNIINRLTLKHAKEICGTVSTSNSKLNCGSWSLPTSKCKVGSKLKNNPKSVCSKCYASRMEKFRSKTEKSYSDNYDKYILSPKKNWIDCMLYLIDNSCKKLKTSYFRWFVGGDLQDSDMLFRIIEIANNRPKINFWMPTKESNLIMRNYINIPQNLCIRISAPLINPNSIKIYPSNINTCTTYDKKSLYIYGFECPSTQRDKIKRKESTCKACNFKCWDKSVNNITYLLH